MFRKQGDYSLDYENILFTYASGEQPKKSVPWLFTGTLLFSLKLICTYSDNLNLIKIRVHFQFVLLLCFCSHIILRESKHVKLFPSKSSLKSANNLSAFCLNLHFQNDPSRLISQVDVKYCIAPENSVNFKLPWAEKPLRNCGTNSLPIHVK